MIDVNFKLLFTLQILHKYYFADQVCNDFSITSSSPTNTVASGHRLVIRQYNNQLYVGTQFINIQPPPPPNQDAPLVPIEQGMQMTFYMWLNNPLFFNYTNLPSSYDTSKIYYFTNRNNNNIPGMNFLSAPKGSLLYNSANTYLPGDIAANSAGMVFSAIAPSDQANQHGLSDTAFWVQVDNNSYASAADVLQWRFSVSTYSFQAAQPGAAIAVSGYNAATNDYTLSVLASTITFSSPALSFPLDLTSLKPGKYLLTVNADPPQWIYINDELNTSRPFAVIDIFNEASPASCNLVDTNGYILSPAYAIYFMNRATKWKYIINSGNSYSITDGANVYQFTAAASTVTSLTPIPLSDQPLDMKVNINSHAICVASADPQRLASAGDSYLYSEIYLNY
ncbi:hypothetical protein HDF18_21065 [Mucilaginibacter sp. X5P1]|uniref:hypothetical protein n=1 Tax=Mucilaginibacter sp. X5P1 TaxID=2723088 RepID=UPI00161969AA|nr:hypothetical protein [Mucilaginibacter sp. X5P1]MBB6140101.1 hypothetical protein [Mucilaginibacter sp. X5P1]